MDTTAITRDTTLCISLSGRPSSTGTRFHNHLYATLGLNWIYKASTTTDLSAAVGGVRALGIRGCGVSMPFKEAVIPMVDSLAESASAIESVNTIVNTDGHLRAYNTDYQAVGDLVDEHGVDPATKFAVLGSGGMAKAVVAALRDRGHRSGTVVARNESTGRALAHRYGFEWRADPSALDASPGLLVNASPVGMAGGSASEDLAFPLRLIEKAPVILDVVAVPAETPLVVRARACGVAVITGAEVLARQAAEQFVLYTGVRPSARQVAAAAAFSRGDVREHG